MEQTLTKQELLKRINALPDGEIPEEILPTLIIPDYDEYDEKSRKKLESMQGDMDHSYVMGSGMIRSINYDFKKNFNQAQRNSIINEYVKTRSNVINVGHPNVGILPNDLEHPLQYHGDEWKLRMIDNGAFIIRLDRYLLRLRQNEDFDLTKHIITRNFDTYFIYDQDTDSERPITFTNEDIFEAIDSIIDEHNWKCTYLYTIDDSITYMDGSYHPFVLGVRISGLTQETIDRMTHQDPKNQMSTMERLIEKGILKFHVNHE